MNRPRVPGAAGNLQQRCVKNACQKQIAAKFLLVGYVMNLHTLRKNVFYIRGFVNIGVITNSRGEAILVDAGHDENMARRLKSVLDENGLSIKGIIITHAHADHYGGACYLSGNSGARIYAREIEKGVIENPILESLSMFGGAYPPAELRRKYFNAPRALVYGKVEPGEIEIEGFPLEIVDLSGHTIGQIGIAFEKVLFCADSIAASDQLQKQGVLKNANIEQSLQTYERLKSRKEIVFVPSHGSVYSDIQAPVDENQELMNSILKIILRLAHDPIGLEELLTRICEIKGVTIKNLSHYYVLHLSVMAYVGCLLDRDQLSVTFSGNRQLFQRRGT